MTRLALSLFAVWTGLAGLLVDVTRGLAVVAAVSPEATGVVLVAALAAWLAYRADWPDGYAGLLPRYVR